MIIDFNCRIYGKEELYRISHAEKALPFSDGTLSDLLEKEAACGVDRIVLPCDHNGNKSVLPLYEVTDAAKDAEKASEIRSRGYIGFFVDPEKLKIPVDGVRLAPVFEAAASLRMAVAVRCGGYTDRVYCAPEKLCAVAEKYSGAALVFSHLCGLDRPSPAARRLCATGAYFDTAFCAFGTPPSTLRRIVSERGADRILFGSGMPWCPPSLISAFLGFAAITGKERELIERGNAEDLLASLI